MADKKISALTPIVGADLVDADLFVVVDTSADETKSLTFGEAKTVLQPYTTILANTTASYTTAEETKVSALDQSVSIGAVPNFGIANMTLNDTSLVVAGAWYWLHNHVCIHSRSRWNNLCTTCCSR